MVALALAPVIVLSTPIPARALTAQDIDWCEGKNGASAEQEISGCTAVINSGKYDGDRLALAFVLRGDAYLYRQSKPDPAIEDFTNAIRLNPKFAHAYYARGDATKVKAFRSSGASAQHLATLALADFSDNIRLKEKPTALDYINRSNAYGLLGRYDEALSDLDEALRIDPSDKNEGLANRCLAYAMLRRWSDALSDCNEIVKRTPGAEELATRALVFLKMGKYANSIADYDASLRYAEAAKSNRDRSKALFGRGMAKARSGDKAGGEADIAMAKQLDPNVARVFAWQGIR